MPRLFFAVDLPQDLKQDLSEVTQTLLRLGRHIRPVARGSFHVTLLFLGEQPEDVVPDFKAIGEQVASAARPCSVSLGTTGFFPRVSFLTLTGEIETLAVLAHALSDSCRQYLERPEDRPFKAHITVARHKQNVRPDEKAAVSEVFKPFEGRSWTCSELVLFESKLTPKGPLYTPLGRFEFKG